MRRRRLLRRGLTLGLALAAACTAQESSDPLPEGQVELATAMAQMGMTLDRCYLKGKTIIGSRVVTMPYPEEGFAYDWHFEKGTLCGITEISSGLKDVRNENGALRFTVAKKDSFFGWGDVSLGEKQIKLGHDSLNVAIRGGRLYGFRMRIRQSLPESSWSFAVRRNYVRGGLSSDVEFVEPVTIKGRDWQTVTFELPYSRRKAFLFYSGVRFITHTPGNDVQIAFVEPLVREKHPFFRKEIVLRSAVRWARCSIQAGINIKVMINGDIAVDFKGGHRYFPYGLWDFDLPVHLFRKGRNVILVETTAGKTNAGGTLLFDGALLCENGNYLRLDSDASWQVAHGFALEQFLAGQASVSWSEVRVRETPEDEQLARRHWFNPSWKGLLSITPADGRDQPVYTSGEDVALNIAVPVREGREPGLTYALYDEMGDNYIAYDTLVRKGSLALEPAGRDRAAVFRADAGELDDNKAYALEVMLTENGTQIETYRYELAVCGPVDQPVIEHRETYTDGMDLKLVYEIDAAAEPERGEFVSCMPDRAQGKHAVKEAPSTVVATPLGRFRQPPERGYLSWKFRIQNPRNPHVVIAEYPDDTTRCQTMWISAAPTEDAPGSYKDNNSANDTVMLGGENPLTHTIQHHHALFFPSGKLYTASFGSLSSASAWRTERSARIGKIRVYEVLNGVPMLRMNDAPGARRWIGQRHEPGPRVVMQSCLSSPMTSRFRRGFILSNTPNFYRTWLLTYMNLVRRMRFAGENCIGYGVYMYQAVLYPSKTFRTSALNTFGSFRDSMTLMARLFEENDLDIFAGLEIISFEQLGIRHTDAEIARGADSPAQIDNTGRQQLALFGRLNPNWLHPEPQKYLNTVVDELAALYGQHKAFKGIIVHTVLGNSWGVTWTATEKEPYLTGYGDYTIGLFEKETGIDIPVSEQDPGRFAARYEWLMANKRSRWITWRRDKMTGVYRDVAARLRTTRDDLKVLGHFFVPAHIEGPFRTDFVSADEAVESFEPYGIDVKELQKDDGVVFLKNVFCNEQMDYYLQGRKRDHRAKAHNAYYTTAFANDGKSGAGMRYGWYEYQLYSPEGWPMYHSSLESWPVPGGEFFADYYANVLVRMNPSIMMFAIVDAAMWNGRESELARFARAYRSVPNGIYERVVGNGLDKNIWVELCRHGNDLYGYVANPQYWDLDVDIDFAGGLDKTDLVNAQPIEDDAWSLRLAPYDVRTFRLANCDDVTVLKAAETSVSDTGKGYFYDTLRDFTNQVARAKEGLERRGKLAEAEELIDACRAHVAQNDWDAAAETLGTTLLWNDLLELAWVPEHEVKHVEIPEASGKLDMEEAPAAWGGSPLFRLDSESDIRFSRNPWTWEGRGDLSLTACMRWDNERLYLGFRVYDDDVKPKANSGDSIELYLDADLHGDYGRNTYDTDDFNLKLVPPATATAEARVFVYKGTETGAKKPAELDGTHVTGRRLEDGYTVSVAVPWTRLGVEVRRGLEIGLDVMVLDFDDGPGFKTMSWSTPGSAIFSNPRVMGRAVLGGAESRTGEATGLEREVRELYAAGRVEDAYRLAIRHRLHRAVSFLYGEEIKAHRDRFLQLTGDTEWEGVLLCRNLAFARMDAIPPRGIEDAKRLTKVPDQSETGQAGPAFYGYRTLIRDAENRGDTDREIDLLFKALLTGQLMSTLSPEACELGRVYEKQKDLRASLAFRVLAWSMEKERRRKGLFETITRNITRNLATLGLQEKVQEWTRWSAAPRESGPFPLYDTYKFPPEWATALEAKLKDYDRSAPRRNYHYAMMLFQVGRVREALTANAESVHLARSASFRKRAREAGVCYREWREAFPRGIVN